MLCTECPILASASALYIRQLGISTMSSLFLIVFLYPSMSDDVIIFAHVLWVVPASLTSQCIAVGEAVLWCHGMLLQASCT